MSIMNFRYRLLTTSILVLVILLTSFFIFSNSISVFLLDKAQRNMYDLNLDAAQRYLNMAKLTNKNIARYHSISGNIELLKKKNYEAALSHFTAALDAGFTPREVVLFKRATIYQFYLVNYEKALSDYLETEKGTITNLSTNPDGALIMLYRPLASVYIELGRAGEAVQSIERIINLSQTKGSQAQNYAILGRAYYMMKDYEKAVGAYKKSLEANFDQLALRVRLARALRDSGDIDGAISELNQVLDANPGYTAARCALAGVYNKSGEYEKAVVEAKKGLTPKEINSSNVFCLYNLGLAYRGLNNSPEAKNYLSQFLSNFEKLNLKAPEYLEVKSEAENLLSQMSGR